MRQDLGKIIFKSFLNMLPILSIFMALATVGCFVIGLGGIMEGVMANFFSNVLKEGFGSILKKVDKSAVVGLDIGSSSIKAVQLSKDKGKVRLDTYGSISLGPYAEKAVGEVVQVDSAMVIKAVMDLYKEAKISATYTGISIQSSASLIFVLNLPVGEVKEMEGVVFSEAKKFIPVPLTEVSLDWWKIPSVSVDEEEEKKTEVLVAAIRNERLAVYNQVIEGAKIGKNFFEIEMFSNLRGVFNNELSSVIVVDMGASTTRIAIVQYGVIKRFNTVKKGSYQITEQIRQAMDIPFEEAEKLKKEIGLVDTGDAKAADVNSIVSSNMRFILNEIKGVILRYEKEYTKAVSKMILTGGGVAMPGVVDYIKSEFDGEIIYGNPFAKVNNPQFLDAALESAGPEFSVALGLALKSFE